MINMNKSKVAGIPTLLLVELLTIGLVASTATPALAQASGTWANTGSISVARELHTSTQLLNGQVLVAGGVGPGSYLASAELYNPATRMWALTGSMNTARERHTATQLQNGQVLVAGPKAAKAEILSKYGRFEPVRTRSKLYAF